MKTTQKVLSLLTLLSLLAPAWAGAQTVNVPKYVNFQAVLRDDSGNLIEDGFIDLEFKVLDQDGDEMYYELQPGVQVVRSAVNVLIGEGVEPGSSPSAPTGGIPFDALNPAGGTKFLQMKVGANLPSDNMELGSVPYAVYAQRALGIVPDILEAEIPEIFVTEPELEARLATYSADIVNTINTSSSSTTINESHIDQTIMRDTEADAAFVNVIGDTMTGTLTAPSLQVNGNIGVTGTVDGVDVSSLSSTVSTHTSQISSLNSTVGNHETRLDSLESGQTVTCSKSIYSDPIDGSIANVTSDACECRIYGLAVDFGAGATAMSGLASVTNIQDDGVSEKEDQNNVVAVQDNTASKMLFLLAHSCDNNPAIGGMAIGLVPGASCPAPLAQSGVNLTFISNKGVQIKGDCIVKSADIILARSSL